MSRYGSLPAVAYAQQVFDPQHVMDRADKIGFLIAQDMTWLDDVEHNMVPESFGAIGDVVVDEMFGLETRRSGVRYPTPDHFSDSAPYDPYGTSRVTGVRGRHLGWRHPMRPTDWEGLLARGVVDMGKVSSGGSRSWRGRVPKAVAYR